VGTTLGADVDAARHVLAEADRLGLDLPGVTDTLVDEASPPSPRRSTTCSIDRRKHPAVA